MGLQTATRAASVPASVVGAHHAPLRGILLLLFSTLLFSASDIFTKLAAAHLPATEVVWLRYVTFALFMLPVLPLAGTRATLTSARPGLQVLRAVAMIGSGVLMTLGLHYLPVAEALATNFVWPVFVTALSAPLLGELVGWRRWAAAVVGLAGALVVIRPGTAAFDPGSLFPLLAALCWSAAAIVTRKMSGADRPLTTMAYTAFVGLAAASLLVPFDFVVPTPLELLFCIAVGVLTSLGHFLLVLAYRHAEASTLAPFSYAQILWSAALAIPVFGSVPDLWTFVGGGLIAASGLYTAHRERIRALAARAAL